MGVLVDYFAAIQRELVQRLIGLADLARSACEQGREVYRWWSL